MIIKNLKIQMMSGNSSKMCVGFEISLTLTEFLLLKYDKLPLLRLPFVYFPKCMRSGGRVIGIVGTSVNKIHDPCEFIDVIHCNFRLKPD